MWSNSCCGHPNPQESYEQAITRRVKEELGLTVYGIEKVADYRYQFERHGIVENELCPVYRGRVTTDPQTNMDEVCEWKWMSWEAFLEELITDKDDVWSPWCKEEVRLFV